MTQAQKAAALLELHHAAGPVVFINAWDAASAAIIEQCGFPAIATSSAAVANALGYADGQNVPFPEMLAAIQRITRSVSVPVTADIESGFAADVRQLESSIEQVIRAGAVGVNLEDAIRGADRGELFPLPEQIARIQAARRAAQRLNIHLVINARVDAYWQSGVEPADALRNTIERGAAYLKAGGDCIFVPGLRKPEHIRQMVEQWHAPINILAGPGVPSIPELTRLGVKRVSYGSGPYRAAMALLRRMATEANSTGTYNALTQESVPHAEMNALFKK
ncbi:MAG TPA: isocitrate lyase/phosphoenolpyruvate mutase family protein [Candidatus Angelobacter sp.]|nr:isocitrate lyase/phosphoenolpyruvate mutase family protein [Candidatus Angelobacter sp.]